MVVPGEEEIRREGGRDGSRVHIPCFLALTLKLCNSLHIIIKLHKIKWERKSKAILNKK